MRKFRLRDFFNKLVWDPGEDPSRYIVYFISRGSPGDIEKIRASMVTRVFSRGFEVEGGRRYIPFHRVVAIIDTGNGREVYRKKDYTGLMPWSTSEE